MYIKALLNLHAFMLKFIGLDYICLSVAEDYHNLRATYVYT